MTILLGSSILLSGFLVPPVSAGLPGDLDATMAEIADIAGADWGIGVIDFSTGETKLYNGDRQFPMQIPHLPLTAMAIELSNAGDIPLDGLIARGEYFWERLHWAQQGGRGMCMAVIWSIGEGRINEWLNSNGYSGTEINGVVQDYPNCPAYEPNLISATNALDYLRAIYAEIQQTSVANIGSNPPFSDHIRETLGYDNNVYGWMDQSSDSKMLFVIVDRSGESDLGIVLLSEGIDRYSDVDEGFRTLYRKLAE